MYHQCTLWVQLSPYDMGYGMQRINPSPATKEYESLRWQMAHITVHTQIMLLHPIFLHFYSSGWKYKRSKYLDYKKSEGKNSRREKQLHIKNKSKVGDILHSYIWVWIFMPFCSVSLISISNVGYKQMQ